MLRGALALGGLWEIFEFLPDWYDKMPISNSTVETTLLLWRAPHPTRWQHHPLHCALQGLHNTDQDKLALRVVLLAAAVAFYRLKNSALGRKNSAKNTIYFKRALLIPPSKRSRYMKVVCIQYTSSRTTKREQLIIIYYYCWQLLFVVNQRFIYQKNTAKKAQKKHDRSQESVDYYIQWITIDQQWNDKDSSRRSSSNGAPSIVSVREDPSAHSHQSQHHHHQKRKWWLFKK